jgi:hypothetical protein
MIDFFTILFLLSWVNIEKGECIVKWDKVSISRYIPRTDTIEYCEQAEYKHIIHETWHRVYYKKLTREQRKEWKELSKPWYVTEYASKSPQEDFAETFRFLYTDFKDEQIKKKQEFIINLLF